MIFFSLPDPPDDGGATKMSALRRDECTGCVTMLEKVNEVKDELKACITKKVPYTLFFWVIGGLFSLACIIMGAGYSITQDTISRLEALMTAKNNEQDIAIAELRKELQEIRNTLSVVATELRAHRELTEGKR